MKKRRAGDKIKDKDGNVLCTVARTSPYGTPLRIDDFTDWQIPIPKPGESVHSAIAEYVETTGGLP